MKISLTFSLFLLSAFGGNNGVAGFSVASSSHRSGASAVGSSSTQLQMATWSDSKAVKDYQEFLSSGKQEIERLPDGPSVIVWNPDSPNKKIGEGLWRMGQGDDIVLTPNDALPPSMGDRTDYPIYITLPPSQIEYFLTTLNDSFRERIEDFVFFSGGLEYGNIEDLLKNYGLCRDSMTQVLWSGIEVPEMQGVRDLSIKLGADANGEEKYAGECAACGKWNGAIAERMERNDVRCSVDFYRDWRRKMWERNIMDAVFYLVGSVREEQTTLQQVANYYEEEASDLIWEVSQQLRGWKAMTLTYGFEERVFGIAEMRGGETVCALVDEAYPWVWGNKVFTESPMFLEYLWYAKEYCGQLQNVDLPPKRGDGEGVSSIMRQGNLRANGKI